MKQLLLTLLTSATIPTMLLAADVMKETVKTGETNSPATPCFLSTNKNSFFRADNLTSATFMKFSPEGFYEVTQREHMGVMPRDGGCWSQDTGRH